MMGRLMLLGLALAWSGLALAVTELEWDDLMPPDWPPDSLFGDIDLDALEDDDPQAVAFFSRLEKEWDNAPVVADLNGRMVRLPGYAIPLDGQGHQVRRFLLVPYFGACIHAPPPPRNQTVLVEMVGPRMAHIEEAFFVVWVEGELLVERGETDLALTGYTLAARKVEPYLEPGEAGR